MATSFPLVRLRVCALAAALALICTAFTGAANAQESEESRRMLKEALTEFNAGRWEEAYALFERLHRAEPSARTLRGMGLSAFEARRYATAITDLSAALLETRRALDATQRAEVRRVIEQADRFVARCALRLEPDFARLSVDGREPLLEKGGTLLLDPGAHEVIASAAGYATQSRTLDVRGGDRIELVFDLVPAGGEASASRAGTDSSAAPESETQRDGISPAFGYVAAGAALLFAGGALGLHFAASGAASDVETACGGRCTPEQADFQIDRSGLSTYQTLSFASWGLFAASAATSAVLFVLSADDGGERSVALRVAPSSVAVAGTF